MIIGRYDIKLYKFPYYKKIIGRKFVNNVKTRSVFVVGNQRSGTTMLLSKLNRHFWIDVLHERSNAMTEWKMRQFSDIDSIIEQSNAKVCIFKPLEDSHRVNEMLEYFFGSKAIFIYRHYSDVINSSMKLGWGNHLKIYIQNINDGIEFKYSGPLNLTTQNVQLVRNLYHDNLSEESCAALIWYLRNTIYFDCNLSDNPAVLLIQYEKVITNPKEEMNRIMNFINLPPSKAVLYDISPKSIKKEPAPYVEEKIKEICDAMFERLAASILQ